MLDAERRAAVDRHVAGCAACRDALDAQRAARSLLAARPDTAVRPGFVTRVMANLPAQDPARGFDGAAAPVGDWLELLDWRAWTIRTSSGSTTSGTARASTTW